jgi:hypothetical protein
MGLIEIEIYSIKFGGSIEHWDNLQQCFQGCHILKYMFVYLFVWLDVIMS